MLRHLITLLFVSADSLLIAQDWAWANNVGGNSNHALYLKLSSDKWGNIYLLGSNSEKSVIAGTAVDSGQYIAKFTASGNPLWVVSLPFNTLDFDADADGNIYIGANFTETCNTFNSTFTSAGENDILLVKLNNAGQEQWARQYGNNRNNRVQSVKATRNGHAVFTGSYEGDTLQFGSVSSSQKPGSTFYLADVSEHGDVKWVTSATAMADSSYYFSGVHIEVTNGNTIYLSGNATQCQWLGCGFQFFAKFTSEGHCFFKESVDLYQAQRIREFRLDAVNNVIMFIEEKYSANIVKYDSTLNQIWVEYLGGYYGCIQFGLFDVSSAGETFLAGYYNDAKHEYCPPTDGIPGFTFQPKGSYDLLLEVLDWNGNVVYARLDGGSNMDFYGAVHFDRSDNFFLAGTFNGSWPGDPPDDTLFLEPFQFHNQTPNQEVFLGRFNPLVTSVENKPVKQQKENIRVFPNPAADRLYVELNKNSTIEISDLLGRAVHTISAKAGTHHIDLDSFQENMYFLTVFDESEYLRTKFIIEKP